MQAMPASRARRGVRLSSRRPSKTISPASGSIAPVRILIRVDLPAPFSPSSPCTSARRTSRSTPSRASTPGNRLVRPRMWRITGPRASARVASAWTLPSSAALNSEASRSAERSGIPWFSVDMPGSRVPRRLRGAGSRRGPTRLLTTVVPVVHLHFYSCHKRKCLSVWLGPHGAGRSGPGSWESRAGPSRSAARRRGAGNPPAPPGASGGSPHQPPDRRASAAVEIGLLRGRDSEMTLAGSGRPASVACRSPRPDRGVARGGRERCARAHGGSERSPAGRHLPGPPRGGPVRAAGGRAPRGRHLLRQVPGRLLRQHRLRVHAARAPDRAGVAGGR